MKQDGALKRALMLAAALRTIGPAQPLWVA